MLMDVVPDDVATEVRDRKQILNTTGKINCVSGELARYRDKEHSIHRDKRSRQLLDAAAKNPVYSFIDAEQKMQTMKILRP